MSLIGDRIDTHREREVREALDPLAKIADRTQAVILGIAHWNKSAGSDLSARITGSGAFKNVPRAIFGASLAELELELGRERRAAAREARRNRGQPIGRPKVLSEAQAALALRMHASGESAITIANTLKVSRATIYRALSVGGN
jgi:hypothetical protein